MFSNFLKSVNRALSWMSVLVIYKHQPAFIKSSNLDAWWKYRSIDRSPDNVAMRFESRPTFKGDARNEYINNSQVGVLCLSLCTCNSISINSCRPMFKWVRILLDIQLVLTTHLSLANPTGYRFWEEDSGRKKYLHQYRTCINTQV